MKFLKSGRIYRSTSHLSHLSREQIAVFNLLANTCFLRPVRFYWSLGCVLCTLSRLETDAVQLHIECYSNTNISKNLNNYSVVLTAAKVWTDDSFSLSFASGSTVGDEFLICRSEHASSAIR